MSQQPSPRPVRRVVIQRPWASPGLGWLLAVIVVILAVLALLHVLAATETLVLALILLLALALLL